MKTAGQIPVGFSPYSEPSPFLDRIGPLFEKRVATGTVFGLLTQDYHCNRRGHVHGGVLITLADIALGKNSSWSQDPPAPLVTASMTTELIGSARAGDWIEAVVDFHKVGRQLAFANCYLRCNDRVIARASAVFANRAGSD